MAIIRPSTLTAKLFANSISPIREHGIPFSRIRLQSLLNLDVYNLVLTKTHPRFVTNEHALFADSKALTIKRNSSPAKRELRTGAKRNSRWREALSTCIECPCDGAGIKIDQTQDTIHTTSRHPVESGLISQPLTNCEQRKPNRTVWL
ncbi:MAG: hypothetical protein ABL962_10095, partial [Fimbriimonadaceae bacterium]